MENNCIDHELLTQKSTAKVNNKSSLPEAIVDKEGKLIGFKLTNQKIYPYEKALEDKWVVYRSMDTYETLFYFLQYKIPILSLVDENQKLIGTISPNSLMACLQSTFYAQEEIGYVYLKTTLSGFSLADLARTFETEYVSILHFNTHWSPDDFESLYIHLIINRHNISSLVPLLEMKGYDVLNYFDEGIDTHLKERYDNLLNYLTIK